MAPTPEQAQHLQGYLADLQRQYAAGENGLPDGQEWVDWALQYLEQEEAQNPAVYDSREAVTAALEQWQLLRPPPPPPSYEDVVPAAPPPPSLREAMDMPEWWAAFHQFTVSEFSSENPTFVDVVRYRTLSPRAIYDGYVASDSPNTVNLASDVKAPIDQAFGNGGEPGYEVYGTAYEAVVTMMSSDTWRRFLAQDGK